MDTKAYMDENFLIITIDGEEVYSIEDCELDEKIENDISSWIDHLMEKSWVDAELLYKIASIIQKVCPNNTINWYTTFSLVERCDYIDKSFDMAKYIENGKAKKHDGDETDDEIKQIVIWRLKEHNIID